MKRLWILGIILGLSSCGGNTTKKELQLGVALYKFDDTFISGIRSAMESRNLLTIPEADINFTDGQGQQPTQNDNLDLFIAEGYQGLGVNMVDRTAASVIINKAILAKIPIVFFNREPIKKDMDSWNRLYYVGAKAEESGRIQGEIAIEYFKNNTLADKNGDGIIQYVMLEGEPGHQDAILRTKYSIQTLIDNGMKVEKLAHDTGMWQRINGQEKMAAWLAAFGNKIEIVFANNDDMALGAIEALKASGYFTKGKNHRFIPVIGVDATTPALDSIKNGYLYATVLNDSKVQGEAVIDLLKELTKKDGDITTLKYNITDGKYIWVPYVPVTIDNYLEFVKK